MKRESSYIEQLRILDATTHPQGDVSNQHLSKDVAVTIIITFHVIPNQYLTTLVKQPRNLFVKTTYPK